VEILGNVLKDIFTYIYHTWRPKKMKINNNKKCYWREEDMKNISCLMCGMSTCTCPRSYSMKSSSNTSGFWREQFFYFFHLNKIFFSFFFIYEKMKIEKKYILPFFKPRWIISNEKCLFFICISFSLTHSLLFTYI
jgi:hypothetical protein